MTKNILPNLGHSQLRKAFLVIVLVGWLICLLIFTAWSWDSSFIFDSMGFSVLSSGVALIFVIILSYKERPGWQSKAVLLIVLISTLTYLPVMWIRAEQVDLEAMGKIPRWDDRRYQITAINLLNDYGYSDYMHLPAERYLLTDSNWNVPKSEQYTFFVAPGLPFMMSVAYNLLGERTLSVRYMFATLIWLTALLLVLTGYSMAEWLGAIAGWAAGLYHINFGGGIAGSESFYIGRVLTEPIGAFWIVLFTFLFTLYLKRNRSIYLYLAAAGLVGIVFTRGNFLTVIPLFYLYLVFTRRKLKEVSIFVLITMLPIAAWSIYASTTSKRLVIFSKQGDYIFPIHNNIGMITGFGPDRLNQGNYYPGYKYAEDGKIVQTDEYFARPGESGWAKGLAFWRDNPEKLPFLFYVKMRSCFWYNDRPGSTPYNLTHIYLAGIGFLLLPLGFRPPKNRYKLFSALSSRHILTIQLVLIAILLVAGTSITFFEIISIWSAIFLIALVRPYGDVYSPGFPLPSWFLLFITSYLASTLLFGGYGRYHYPLDPSLILLSFVSLFTLIYEFWKKDRGLAVLFLVVAVHPVWIAFQFLFTLSFA